MSYLHPIGAEVLLIINCTGNNIRRKIDKTKKVAVVVGALVTVLALAMVVVVAAVVMLT